MTVYKKIPLYIKLAAALVIGVVAGHLLGHRALLLKPYGAIVLQLLRLLATPLISLAVIRALIQTNVSARNGIRLFYFLITNTLAAILIGLLVTNVVKPGRWIHIAAPIVAVAGQHLNLLNELIGKIPADFVNPYLNNDIISIVFISLIAGVALRTVRNNDAAEGLDRFKPVEQLIQTLFDAILVVLRWTFEIIPFGIVAVVAETVGVSGIAPIISLSAFVGAVILALLLQVVFYLTRLSISSWVSPWRFLSGSKEALLTAFSTASSAATLPITFTAVRERIGVKEESASLGVLVGGTFNHDGAALYEAMAALFVAQAIGLHLSLPQQTEVVLISIVASIGSAGIPSAGLVTLVAVLTAVHLPTEYVALLVPLDWILDRFRTTVNVMGDMVLTCLLDGKQRDNLTALTENYDDKEMSIA